MAKHPPEKHAEYMRNWRATPEGKAKISEYNKRKHRERWDKMSAEERRCWNYRKKYGITRQEAVEKIVDQRHQCPCCEDYLEIDWAVVDHNHDTNQVRGMLCNSCNKAIGFVYENKETLQNMIKYLDKWNG